MDDLRQRKKNLIFFPLGTVGRDMMYALVTNYLYSFVLFTHELTAAQLSAIAAIMVAARIFDALNDPIMGNIIERTRTKYGKFKPWLVIGILSTSLVIYLAFNTSLQGWSFVWFFGIIYFLYSRSADSHADNRQQCDRRKCCYGIWQNCVDHCCAWPCVSRIHCFRRERKQNV